MTVTVTPMGIKQIEVECAMDKNDVLRVEDFVEGTCFMKIFEADEISMIEVRREDMLAFIKAIEPWAKGEVG